MLTKPRDHNAHLVDCKPYLTPPSDPSGRRVDLSDRMLICSSSNMRNEIVVGGADHALYSIDVNDSRLKPVTMYGKRSGHTDWVSAVAHLANGKVLSGGMDGRLCLWSESSRSSCTEVQRDSTFPVSKIVSDSRNDVAVCCSYAGMGVWSFGSQTNCQEMNGHANPVLECSFRDHILVSGDKGGALMYWDVNRGQALNRFRAHPGAITAMECLPDRMTAITCGADGFVKVWDPRTPGSGMVAKIAAHVHSARPSPAVGGGARPGRATSSGGRGRVAGRQAAAAPSGGEVSGSAISVMSCVQSRGAADLNYIVTGSGGGESRQEGTDSLCVIDVRRSFSVVKRWEHHRNGVYALCVVGDECVFSSDGIGNLLCHQLLLDDSGAAFSAIDDTSNLKYGIGASETGAVRRIHCLNGKLVTVGEDGKVLVFDYTDKITSFK